MTSTDYNINMFDYIFMQPQAQYKYELITKWKYIKISFTNKEWVYFNYLLKKDLMIQLKYRVQNQTNYSLFFTEPRDHYI